MTVNVLIPIANGSEEVETVCIFSTLKRAGATVTIASVETSLQVITSRGLKITADRFIDECAEMTFDLIACPGGMPGAIHLQNSKTLMDLLKKQRDSGRFFAGICSAPAVTFLPHGLLQGYQATCYPASDFTEQFPAGSYVDAPVVVDRHCVTSQGPGTALAFALQLVELLFDRKTRDQLAQKMRIK